MSEDACTAVRWRGPLAWLLPALMMLAVFLQPALGASPDKPDVYTYPADVVDGALKTWVVEAGLIFVPENRSNPQSRLIPVAFWRLAGTAAAVHAPVFVLPGGPGEWFAPADLKDAAFARRIRALMASGRDIVVVNQRGHPETPATAPFTMGRCAPAADDAPDREADLALRERDCFAAGVERWRARGVDVSGYSLPEMVEDIEAIRSALNYPRIALFGISFGSQWSIGYMHRYPHRVERAVLGGVEPIALGYDSPEWVWQAIERVLNEASASPALASIRPAGGFAEALRVVLRRLDARPVRVPAVHPKWGQATLTLSGLDLRQALRRPFPDLSDRENLEHLPKFVSQIANGDYRYLARWTLDDRRDDWESPMMNALVDASIGIDAALDRQFQEEAGKVPLGDVNRRLRARQGVQGSAPIDASWRVPLRGPMELLLIQGDADLSTPLENIDHVTFSQVNARRVIIERGSHFAIDEALEQIGDFGAFIAAFLESAAAVPSQRGAPTGAANTLRITLAPYAFKSSGKEK